LAPGAFRIEPLNGAMRRSIAAARAWHDLDCPGFWSDLAPYVSAASRADDCPGRDRRRSQRAIDFYEPAFAFRNLYRQHGGSGVPKRVERRRNCSRRRTDRGAFAVALCSDSQQDARLVSAPTGAWEYPGSRKGAYICAGNGTAAGGISMGIL